MLLVTNHLKWDFGKLFCHAVFQFVLKLRESIKLTFFNSDYELIKQFISINLVEISSKRVKFWGAFLWTDHVLGVAGTFKIDGQLPWKKCGKEIDSILYQLLTISLIIKVKIGLNLHFLFISCKLSV